MLLGWCQIRAKFEKSEICFFFERTTHDVRLICSLHYELIHQYQKMNQYSDETFFSTVWNARIAIKFSYSGAGLWLQLIYPLLIQTSQEDSNSKYNRLISKSILQQIMSSNSWKWNVNPKANSAFKIEVLIFTNLTVPLLE